MEKEIANPPVTVDDPEAPGYMRKMGSPPGITGSPFVGSYEKECFDKNLMEGHSPTAIDRWGRVKREWEKRSRGWERGRQRGERGLGGGGGGGEWEERLRSDSNRFNWWVGWRLVNGWLVGWSVGLSLGLAGWLIGWVAGWSVGWLAGCLVGWLISCLLY